MEVVCDSCRVGQPAAPLVTWGSQRRPGSQRRSFNGGQRRSFNAQLIRSQVMRYQLIAQLIRADGGPASGGQLVVLGD